MNGDQHLARSLASVVELVSRINQTETLEDAAKITSVMLGDWFQADQVMIAWQKRPASGCRLLVADPGHAGETSIIHNRQARKTLDAMCLAAAEEVLTRDATTDSHATRRRDQIALLAVNQYAKATDSRRILGVSLGGASNAGEGCKGVIMARFQRTLSESEASEILNALDACRMPLFHALHKTAATQWSARARRWLPWLATQGGMQQKQRTSVPRMLILVATLLLAGISLVPIHYQVPAACQLQPVGRRYAAAPDNGALQSVLVGPGDDVRRGQVLARLDPREIELEISAKRAELQRRIQEQKSALAEQDFANSNLAALRVKGLQSEVDQLTWRRQKLDVTSPIDGIVVSGDWKSSQGTPVGKGDTLFEIAPPTRYRVELAIAESDILHTRATMPVSLRLDAMPFEPMQARLLRVHPRCELRDNDNVFIGEAELDDPTGRLRPGMRGRAQIESGTHPLAWNLFHKATAALGRLWRN